jgi:hypothetical protein
MGIFEILSSTMLRHMINKRIQPLFCGNEPRIWHANITRRRRAQGAVRYDSAEGHLYNRRRRELEAMTEKQLAEFFVEQHVATFEQTMC